MKLRHTQSALVLLGLLLASAGTARAGGPLVTPALSASGSNDLQCRVLNVGPRDADVRIEIVDWEGAVIAAIGPTAIFPGWTQSISTPDAPGVGYCRVTGIPKGRARVTLCVRDAGGTCIAALGAGS